MVKKYKALKTLSDHRGVLFKKGKSYKLIEKKQINIWGNNKKESYTLESEIGNITFHNTYIDNFEEIIDDMPDFK